jgi:hypothetical protein
MRMRNKQWNKVRKQLGRELARFADQEQEWMEHELAQLMERAQERYGATKAQVAKELVRHLDHYQTNANQFMEGLKDRLQPERRHERRNQPWVALVALLGLLLAGRWLWRRQQLFLTTQKTAQ